MHAQKGLIHITMHYENHLLIYDLPALKGGDAVAFSTTRGGGCSSGAYASMNCTPYTGDSPTCVERNQQLLCDRLPQLPQTLVIPYQTHGCTCLDIDETYLSAPQEQKEMMLQGVDALTTCHEGVCICISTADCIPVIIYDYAHHAAAAIHAGWRGTVQRIVSHTLQQMQHRYGTEGRECIACIGPGISLQAFETGDEVYEAFAAAGFPMSQLSYRHPATQKYHLDLPTANLLQLKEFGIPDAHIEQSNLCTYNQYENFFSARRLGIRSGRILTGILMK